MNEVLVSVDGVSKKFCRSLKRSLWYGLQDIGSELSGRRHGGNGTLRKDEFWALQNVSFELRRGQCLGLIGRNGAGKTTLLRMLNGLIRPDEGRIEIRGHVGALISLGAGFNPVLSGRENIYINAAVLGLNRKVIDRKIDDIIDFAELRDSIDAPVQSYSSGMQVRLGFSVASALEPDVLLLDEILAVGDTAFRSKCFKRIGEVMHRAAVIFVSHSEVQINRICDSVIFLNAGRVSYKGDTTEALTRYRESQQSYAPETQTIIDACISSIGIHRLQKEVSWGGMLDLQIAVTVNQTTTLGLILVHFALDSEFKANAEFRLHESGANSLQSGTHVLQCRVGPLHLAHGRYSLSFSVFDGSRKRAIAQMLDFCSIQVTSPVVSGGASHLIPMSFDSIAIEPGSGQRNSPAES